MRINVSIGLIVLAMAPHVCLAQSTAPVDQTVTPLVQSVQDAGAGPLAGVSTTAMYLWMSYHHDVAVTASAQCATIAASAPAAWFDGLEGSTCFAARAAAAIPVAAPSAVTAAKEGK